LERVSLGSDDVVKVLDGLLRADNTCEAMVLSTCNRVEVYAIAETFHGALDNVMAQLATHAGCDVSDLADHLYVYYAGAAVEHLFSVAAGLDSLVLGESQVLGQLRQAYGIANEAGTVGKTLHELAQQALRVGKRVHSETGIDGAGASVVSEALADAEAVLGDLTGRNVLLIGAGSMGGLAAAHLKRAGVGEIVIANRTPARGERLVASLREEGCAARTVALSDLSAELAAADMAVTCTGAVGAVVTGDIVADAMNARAVGSPLLLCDLGLPRDIESEVADLPGVKVIDLETLQRRLAAEQPEGSDSQRASRIVAEEVRNYLATQRSAEVTPTVTALRQRAAEVVNAELLRLDSRLPGIDQGVRDELGRTVRRVVDKLLHTPTVRVKQLASLPGGAGYADALRELFELDQQAPAAIGTPQAAEGGRIPGGAVLPAAQAPRVDTSGDLSGSLDRPVQDGEDG
jgi:glutamyl-tRNA reductase